MSEPITKRLEYLEVELENLMEKHENLVEKYVNLASSHIKVLRLCDANKDHIECVCLNVQNLCGKILEVRKDSGELIELLGNRLDAIVEINELQ